MKYNGMWAIKEWWGTSGEKEQRVYSAHRDFLTSVTVTAFLSQFLNQIFLG